MGSVYKMYASQIPGVALRREDPKQEAMFSYVSPEQRVPQDHPLRPVREMVDTILKEMSGRFARLYSERGRPSIAPERLLRGVLCRIFYSRRSGRLLAEPIAQPFFQRVLRQAKPYLSDEHFTVDGTLIEAWASQKSFRPKDGEPPSGTPREADFHGQRRSNDTHQSTTDPDARLYKKSKGSEAKLSYLGHGLMENRNGLLVRTM